MCLFVSRLRVAPLPALLSADQLSFAEVVSSCLAGGSARRRESSLQDPSAAGCCKWQALASAAESQAAF